MIQLKASEHAKQRIKERLNITDKRQIKEVVKSAYHTGISKKRNYIPSHTLWWINRKVDSYFGRCGNWRIYKGHLFLYSKTLTLVTVIQIPTNLVPKKDFKRF